MSAEGTSSNGSAENLMTDTNSGLEIRITDNTAKEGDDFQLGDQYARPMTEEEIKAKIEEVLG